MKANLSKLLPIGIALITILLVFALFLPPGAANAYTPPDYMIANGWFYTQAAGSNTPAGTGYAIRDEGKDNRGQSIKFWSEFQRLGGVAVLGYPASRRFIWDGYVCQATQRVVMQWRPEIARVYFVNIMDMMTVAGKDSYLEAVRQIPKPANYAQAEQNMTFQQIVAKRYALLDANPAIKAKFFSLPDPLNLNGLPTAPIADMGNVYVLRAQRVILQQWKVNTPWAKAGTVTMALGGDLAKETGLLAMVDQNAVVPEAAPPQVFPTPTPTATPTRAPTPTPQPSTPALFTGTVTEDYATIRAEPSINAAILGRVYQGQKVRLSSTVIGGMVNGYSDLWYRHASGGYSSSLYIEPDYVGGATVLVGLVDARRIEYWKGGILLKRFAANVGRPRLGDTARYI